MGEERARKENDGFCGREGSERQRKSGGLRVFSEGQWKGMKRGCLKNIKTIFILIYSNENEINKNFNGFI